MKSKEEIKTWLLENATNEEGQIDISNIDFGDKEVILDQIKAVCIYNRRQEAKSIENYNQKADTWILNDYQKAKERIYNGPQEAGEMILNDYQKAYRVSNDHQKAKRSISNFEQEAESIDNGLQKADEDISNKGQEAGIIIGNKKEWEVKE